MRLPGSALLPPQRLLTRAEYHRQGEQGHFRGQRVELIEGEVLLMSPQGPGHYWTINVFHRVLAAAFGPNYWVRMQGPLALSDTSEPEPDLCVVNQPMQDGHLKHPQTALLVVEVSDSSLLHDRDRKGSIYATSGILDYWIANLQDQVLEVYREPILEQSPTQGGRYANKTVYRRGDAVRPLARPDLEIAVASLLE